MREHEGQLLDRESLAIIRRSYGLTAAESRVALLIAEGFSIAQVAERLLLSPETVRTHLRRAFEQTDTHRQVDLVRTLFLGAWGRHRLGLQHASGDSP
jgi:DNA-binding CsgD family transcriptional regulator